ncbi:MULTISPECIES: hypothetical protein [unclassified Streptomyces]|uniref:hypothetical protein n=1 Tax=unclassified Streptomyces TaxID=2593676 RepID=UPI0022508981|nr:MULTISPECIES: hypothetical protein [unclassified Streptomyces]MCX5049646.1 hypothetical protein [Streptomyces sp. NBC_00474]MCX5055627.1 hypothetical protein [Streptomyces sp. NBC_00452]MCX5247527.1 hypothetical protein [Streptomyces sp. NBC_00201]MCX5286692.1 hypothetical protein [Streptomyces sp. NBC_00183]
MAYTRRTTGSRKRMFRTAGVIGALALGASLMAAPQASADDSPTTQQLLDACSWADSCTFHPTSYWTYTGPTHQVGSTAFNCASQTNQHRIDWSDTTASTNSVGVSISVGVKFWAVYEAEVEASYGHTWTTSHTDTESDTVNIPAGRKGWIERGTAKQQATGWYELHFGSRYYGHYIWYINNYQSSGFNNDQPSTGFINFKDAEMTSGERSAHCG